MTDQQVCQRLCNLLRDQLQKAHEEIESRYCNPKSDGKTKKATTPVTQEDLDGIMRIVSTAKSKLQEHVSAIFNYVSANTATLRTAHSQEERRMTSPPPPRGSKSAQDIAKAAEDDDSNKQADSATSASGDKKDSSKSETQEEEDAKKTDSAGDGGAAAPSPGTSTESKTFNLSTYLNYLTM